MFIQHTNRFGQIYYLYQGTTKTGKPKYFFSTKIKEGRLDNVPDGFEVYENPDAQVFLIKKIRSLITNSEKQIVTSTLKENQDIEYFIVDIKKNVITIYTASNPLPDDVFPFDKTIDIQKYLRYIKEIRFILVDENKRHFIVEGFYYRHVCIDDWIEIGGPDQLLPLAKKFISRISKELDMDIPF